MKIFKNTSLKSKMISLNSVLVFFTVILISVIAILSFNSINNRNAKVLSKQIINQVAQNIEYYSQEMTSISKIANYDYHIQKYLSGTPATATQQYDMLNSISLLFENVSSTREDITTILLFDEFGRPVSNIDTNDINTNYRFVAQSWYKKAQNTPDGFVMVKPHRQSYINNSSELVISFIKRVNRFDSQIGAGIIMMDLNLNALKKICSNVQLGDEGYIMVVDADGNVIYHPDYSYMYRAWDEMYIKEVYKEDDPIIFEALNAGGNTLQKNINGRNLIITSQTVSDLGWTIIGIYPQAAIIAEQTQIALLITAIGFIIVAIGILATTLIYTLIFDPISKLQKKMKQAEEGILNISEKNHYTDDEIGSLNKNFDNMISQIHELMLRIKSEERQKRKAELNFLQAQINPHFLYNTLDSIVWMAETNHKDVVKMTESLAKLFRLSLSKGKEIIKIRDEVSHVENYLIIQKMRYTNKFDFKIDVEEQILDMQTLKLILQPLVENAIYHGIKNTRHKGNILIKGRLVMDNVLLQVMDDGAGIEHTKAAMLLSDDSKKGIGIKNVDERIKLYYGEQYGLEINSERDIGTVVDIWIPALPYSDDLNE
ncbi:MAG: sensor histidine kinase [Christensenellaceae bacterium]